MYLQLHDPAFLAVASGGTPALDLFFSATKALDSRITFSRGSSATFINSSGLVETAGSGVARFTHDPVTLASLGLLIEESRTNILLQTEAFDDITWTKNAVTATAASGTSPDGTNNAVSLVPSTASAGHNILQFVTKAASAITYTVSVFAKANGYNFVGFRIDDGGANGAYACFNVSNGTVSTAASTSGTGFSGASASVIAYKSGWYKLILTFTSNLGLTIRPVITVQDATGNPFTYSFAGNGTSGVLMWGIQLEVGAFATSYIKNVNTLLGVIRAADVATMSGTNFTSWYNSSEGDWVARVNLINPLNAITNTARIIGGNSASAPIGLFAGSGGVVFSNDTSFSGGSVSNLGAITSINAGVSYVSNASTAFANGTKGTTASYNSSSLTSIAIGSDNGLSQFLNGTISRIRYYRRRFSDANLQTLTT